MHPATFVLSNLPVDVGTGEAAWLFAVAMLARNVPAPDGKTKDFVNLLRDQLGPDNWVAGRVAQMLADRIQREALQ